MIVDNVALAMPEGVTEGGRLRCEGGLIRAVGPADTLPVLPGETVWDGQNGLLCPRFIDLHVHGALGRDAMEATPAAFEQILGFHASGGTTALALTSVPAPTEDLLRLLCAAETWRANAYRVTAGPELLGVHLEGPYFSPAKAGMHRREFLRTPSPAETAELLRYANIVTQMTLAPELPGALQLADALHEHGIIASAGHSDAWDEEARAGFERGVSHATHLFNAMSGARRRGPYRVAGLLEFALSEPGMLCELIADGHHVSPTLLRMAYHAKGAGGICLVTDASPGAGLPEGSRHRFAGQDCLVGQGVCLTGDHQTLAGSSLTMAAAVRNMTRLAGVPLHESVRMATLNPARVLHRAHERGQLIPGGRADLVLLTRELDVAATFVGGEIVYRPEAVPAAING